MQSTIRSLAAQSMQSIHRKMHPSSQDLGVRCVILLRTLAIILAPLVACGSEPGEMAEIPEWTLSTTPDLVIGEDGTPEGELDRVGAVRLLPSGEILVVTGGSDIRIFAPTGAFHRQLSREGSGPGEFTQIGPLWLLGDTLLVTDLFARRVARLLLTGTVVTTIPFRFNSDQGRVSVQGRHPDGRWLVSTSWQPLPTGSAAGHYPDSTLFGLGNEDGTGPIQWIGSFANTGSIVSGSSTGPAAFWTQPEPLDLNGAFHLVDRMTGALFRYRDEELVRQEVSVPIPLQALTPELVARLRATELEQRPGHNEAFLAFLDFKYSTDALPRHLPLLGTILVDRDGSLWLQAYSPLLESSAQWVILRPDWTLGGRLTTPPGFRVRDAGPDWVLGVQEDADRVQRVMRYGLQRR